MKKRKWDEGPPPSAMPTLVSQHIAFPSGFVINFGAFAQASMPVPQSPAPAPTLSEDAVKRAQEAAALVLAKAGISSDTKPQAASSRLFGEISREVVINEAPTEARIHLTKRSVQDDISGRTGTVITLKGRYYPPGMPRDEKEKPIYLKITPGAAHQVSLAHLKIIS